MYRLLGFRRLHQVKKGSCCTCTEISVCTGYAILGYFRSRQSGVTHATGVSIFKLKTCIMKSRENLLFKNP